jgi:hypothetical protein
MSVFAKAGDRRRSSLVLLRVGRFVDGVFCLSEAAAATFVDACTNISASTAKRHLRRHKREPYMLADLPHVFLSSGCSLCVDGWNEARINLCAKVALMPAADPKCVPLHEVDKLCWGILDPGIPKQSVSTREVAHTTSFSGRRVFFALWYHGLVRCAQRSWVCSRRLSTWRLP